MSILSLLSLIPIDKPTASFYKKAEYGCLSLKKEDRAGDKRRNLLEYKKIVEASGLKHVKITIKGTSACINPNTKDPVGRAILDGLGKNESLEGYVVSIYVEGRSINDKQKINN